MKFLYTLALLPLMVFANEESTYCDYTMEKAKAEQILLQSPKAQLQGGRDSVGSLNVIGVGVNESLSNYLKGSLSHQIGERDCKIYRNVSEIQKHVVYDLTIMNNNYTQHRIDLIDQEIDRLTALAVQEKERVAAGSTTIITVNSFYSVVARLKFEKAKLSQQIELNTTIDPSETSLKQLIDETKSLYLEQGHDQDKQASYDNWDVSLSVGEGTPIKDVRPVGPYQPYILLNMSYSFGSIARNRALAKSSAAYSSLQTESVTGPMYLADQLQRQIAGARHSNQMALESYDTYDNTVNVNKEDMAKIDSIESHRFLMQLEIDSSMNKIEVESIKYNIAQMDKYLAVNF